VSTDLYNKLPIYFENYTSVALRLYFLFCEFSYTLKKKPAKCESDTKGSVPLSIKTAFILFFFFLFFFLFSFFVIAATEILSVKISTV
jgi:hypothetical protein